MNVPNTYEKPSVLSYSEEELAKTIDAQGGLISAL